MRRPRTGPGLAPLARRAGALLLLVGLAGPADAFPGAPGLGARRSGPPRRPTVRDTGASTLERYPVPLLPGYPLPPPALSRLPAETAPAVQGRCRGAGCDRVWIPSRTEIVVGIDPSGRIVHVLEYIPAHALGR